MDSVTRSTAVWTGIRRVLELTTGVLPPPPDPTEVGESPDRKKTFWGEPEEDQQVIRALTSATNSLDTVTSSTKDNWADLAEPTEAEDSFMEADIFLTGEQLVRNRLTDKNKRIRWHANNTEFRRLRSPRSEMIDLSVDAPSAEHMFSSFEDAVGELSKKFNVTPLNKEDSAKVMQDSESKIEGMQQRQQRKRQRENQLRKEAEKVERARFESITDKLTKKIAHTALQQRVNQRVR
ncbi:hypothetical protein PF002_g29731 [Phytophthora fragariae]|uniref:Uncharacterized protein n=1 Tax=Phytophthora fragariae TaxID=53985 RepID=A0A6A3W1N8_9STRA|nr:hypothetical protein PF002_g29731 [Phytophthora fragariae]